MVECVTSGDSVYGLGGEKLFEEIDSELEVMVCVRGYWRSSWTPRRRSRRRGDIKELRVILLNKLAPGHAVSRNRGDVRLEDAAWERRPSVRNSRQGSVSYCVA